MDCVGRTVDTGGRRIVGRIARTGSEDTVGAGHTVAAVVELG